MANVTQLGAPVQTGRRSSGEGKKKTKKTKSGTTTVIMAPAQQEVAKPKRKGSKGKGRRSSGKGGFIEKANLKGGAIAAGAAYFGSQMLAGKTTGGIPNTALAGVGLAYFDDGKSEWMRDASTGLIVFGAIEYGISSAIRKGELEKMLVPYIDAVSAEGGDSKVKAELLRSKLGIVAAAGETGYENKMDALANRWASGG